MAAILLAKQNKNRPQTQEVAFIQKPKTIASVTTAPTTIAVPTDPIVITRYAEPVVFDFNGSCAFNRIGCVGWWFGELSECGQSMSVQGGRIQ